jgi:hypothetical protein
LPVKRGELDAVDGDRAGVDTDNAQLSLSIGRSQISV